MSYNLFIDDERYPHQVKWVDLPEVDWVIARDFWEVKRIIKERGLPRLISFDHDLGDPKYTGKTCAEFIAMFVYDGQRMPRYFVHSMNPVGRKNIELFLRSVENEVANEHLPADTNKDSG